MPRGPEHHPADLLQTEAGHISIPRMVAAKSPGRVEEGVEKEKKEGNIHEMPTHGQILRRCSWGPSGPVILQMRVPRFRFRRLRPKP